MYKSNGRLLSICFVFLLIILFSVSAYSYPVKLTADVSKYDLGSSVEYYEDPHATLTFQDVISLDNQNKFKTSMSQPLNFGYSSSTYWVSFSVLGDTDPASGWVLDIPYAPLDYVKLYVPNGKGDYVEFLAGDKIHAKDKSLNYKNAVFVLGDRLLPYQQYYLKVVTSGAVNLPIFLWKGAAFTEHVSDVQTGMGIYIGIMLALLLYNIFLYFSIKDKDFILCAFAIISYTMVQVVYNGMATQYLWSDFIWWANNSLVFFAILLFFSIAIFTNSFLDLKRNAPLGNKIMLAFIGYYAALYGLFWFIGYRLTSILTAFTGIILIAFVFFLVIYIYSKGYKAARFLLLAWFFFLFGLALLLLKLVGILPHVFITEYSVQIGFTLNATLLSFALTDKINIMRHEKQLAQKIALDRLKESETLKSEFLAETERLVDERTKELEELNRRLLEMASYDVLTGLFNRRVFNEAIDREFNRARRLGTEISIILIDIDYFKNYNDSYGHLEGDSCLAELAAMFKNVVNRATDIVARYGGEEFAVILCDTGKEGAVKIAETIRETVSAACIPHKMAQLGHVTVSCGVASKVPNIDDSLENFINEADKALYKAKSSGRNQVAIFPF